MKKKHIRLTIDDKLDSRLTDLCDHHGDKTHLIREGIKMIVTFKENYNKEVSNHANSPTTS